MLIAAGFAAVILFAALGFAVDFGRLYIVRSEAQSFVDSAALNAALELDGTAAGLNDSVTSARDAVGRWDLAQFPFREIEVRFSPSLDGPWSPLASAPVASPYVRVRTTASVKLYFLPVLASRDISTVAASAVAAQVERTGFREGLLPYAMLARSHEAPHYGLLPGNLYTLRGPAACPGDTAPGGFIEQSAPRFIRQSILNGFQTEFRRPGDAITFTPGDRNVEWDALHTRILQDSDSVSLSFAAYRRQRGGNGRRLVVCPIRNSAGFLAGFGGFFLRPAVDSSQPWCAEYVGSFLQGGSKSAARPGGAWMVRLVL